MEIKTIIDKEIKVIAIGTFDTEQIESMTKDTDEKEIIYMIEYLNVYASFTTIGAHEQWERGLRNMTICVGVTKNKIILETLLGTDIEEWECMIELTKEELSELAAYIINYENRK